MCLKDKRYLIINLILSLFLTVFLSKSYANSSIYSSPVGIIQSDIMSQNNHDWLGFLSVRTENPELPECVRDYKLLKEKNPEPENNFMNNIKEARISEIKELPIDLVRGRIGEYLEFYKENEIATYYVGINYSLKKENRAFYNGVNYRFYVLALEEGQWKIIESSEAPVYWIVQSGYGFGTANEKTALKIQDEYKRTGKFTNPKGEIITIESDDHSQPNYIRVYRTTGPTAGQVEEVDFYTYIINVLPNEWPSDYPTESLRAGALAVKMFGWYRFYNWKYPNSGYHVKDSDTDQVYIPGSSSSSCKEAVNSVQGKGVDVADGNLLYIDSAGGNYWNGWSVVYNTGGSGLNIRSGPGLQYTSIYKASEGEHLVVLSSGKDYNNGYRWWLVKTGGIYNWTPGAYTVGWAAGNFLWYEQKNGIVCINQKFVGWMTQFGTKYHALQENGDHEWMVHYFYDYTPNTNGQLAHLFTYTPNRSPNAPYNIEPSAGATGVSLTPTLRASSFSDQDLGDYHWKTWWEIRRVADNTLAWDSGWRTFDLTSTVVPPGFLQSNTTYKWRVRYMDNKGAWSEPLPIATEFTTTTSLPSPPILVSPQNGSHQACGINFVWNSVSGATNYELYLRFPNGSSGSDTTTSTSYSYSPGLIGQYYWKVRAYANGTWSNYSNEWTFYFDGLSSPTLVSPLNGATTTSLRPVFQWNAVSCANYYELQLARDASFSDMVRDKLSVSGTSWQLDNQDLTIGQTYYWRVRSSNPIGLWSDTWRFTIASSISLNLYYGWNCISCPGEPVINNWNTIKSGNPNIALIVEYDTIQRKFVTANNIEFGKSYFVGVIANTQISLQYYPRNSLTRGAKYGWNSLGSISYSIPVSSVTSTPSGKLALIVRYNNSQNKYEMTSTIEPGVGYMAGCISDCTLNMSYSPPAPPAKQKVVTKPSWESVLTVNTQTGHKKLVFGMSKSASDGIDLYDIPIPPLPDTFGGVNAGWATGDLAFELLETSFVKDASESNWKLSIELSEDGEISWQNLPNTYNFILLYDNKIVNMNNERSISLPIGKHSLIISAKSKANIPDKTKLFANYPNPCNPETWIPYQLSIDSKVKVMIYSLNGDLVRVLDLGYKPAGIYVERSKAAYWDGRNESGERVSSGIYFYTLITPEFSQTRKLVIKR